MADPKLKTLKVEFSRNVLYSFEIDVTEEEAENFLEFDGKDGNINLDSHLGDLVNFCDKDRDVYDISDDIEHIIVQEA